MGFGATLKEKIRAGATATVSNIRANIKERQERKKEEDEAYRTAYRKEKISALRHKARMDARARVNRPSFFESFGEPPRASRPNSRSSKRKTTKKKKRATTRRAAPSPRRSEPRDMFDLI